MVAAVDDLTDMLDYDSEDIDGMDDDAGDDQEPAPNGRRKATPSHNVCMVDTPKGSDNEEKWDVAKDNSPNRQTRRLRKRRPKTGIDKNGTHMDPALEQGEAVDDAHVNRTSNPSLAKMISHHQSI